MENNPRIPFRLANEGPHLVPPDGKSLIVHIVVNLEVWPFDEPMPRSIFQATHGRVEKPDLPNFGWVEYGLRCGLPRLIRALRERELPASNFMNAALPDFYPSAAEAALAAGWELSGHALVQRSLRDEADEEQVIASVRDRLARLAGHPPRGWLGPGSAETDRTPELLATYGFTHVYEWQFDDLPTWLHTQRGPLVAMPYALETNDVTAMIMHNVSVDEWLRRFDYVLQTFDAEIREAPRILTIALHPHVAAIPMRFPALLQLLDRLLGRSDTIFMTGNQIADWYIGQVPPQQAGIG